MTARGPDTGVTLIEMLVALSVFSLIGLASFSVLDTIVRTDRQSSGRLEHLARLDVALRLFEADVLRARPGALVEQDRISLPTAGALVTYQSGTEGVLRRIERADEADVQQQILPPPASALWRVIRLDGIEDGAEPSDPPIAVEVVLVADDSRSREIRKLVPLPRLLPGQD